MSITDSELGPRLGGYVEGGRWADFKLWVFDEPDGTLLLELSPPTYRAFELSDSDDDLGQVTDLDQVVERLGAPVRWMDLDLARAVHAREEWSFETPEGLTREQTKQVAKVAKADPDAMARAGAQDPLNPEAQGKRWFLPAVGQLAGGGLVVVQPIKSTGLLANFPVHGSFVDLQLFDPIGAPARQLGGVPDPGTDRWRPPALRVVTRTATEAVRWLAGQGLTVSWTEAGPGMELAMQYAPGRCGPAAHFPVNQPPTGPAGPADQRVCPHRDTRPMDLALSRRRWLAVAVVATAGLAGCTRPEPTAPKGSTMTSPQPSSPQSSGTQPSSTPSATLRPIDQQLIQAAWDNDLNRATELIGQGADVNAQDHTQQSAYLIATSEGYLELLRLTLAHGAQINAKDSWNGTGLIRAAERGHHLVVGELLQAKIDRDHVNRIGYQAIHEAIWLGRQTPSYAATVRVLGAGGVQLDRPSGTEGLTPLQMTEQKKFTEQEKSVTALTGKAPTDPDRALLAAATSGDADAAAVALRAGAHLETRDGNRRTPLLLAASHDRVDVAQVLVALGASPDALDDRHDTPWLVTGVTGSVAMLEALLPANPDLTIKNRFGGISLIPACERGHLDYVRRVVKTPINVNHVNDLGWTGLLEAVILGDGSSVYVEIVKTLLAAGADPELADRDGVTALQHARRQGQKQVAAVLEAAS